MRTTDRIGFKLIIKEPDTAERTIVVCPRYDGLKMKWQRESGKVYHTLDFEGNLEFWGVDFVTLLNCPLRTVFELVVFLKGRGEVGRSEFRKTDCEWNLNDGWCKVDISTYDKYSKINDHKDDEYNLVKLGISKKGIGLYVFPQNQVYFQDDRIITLYGYGEPSISQASAITSHDTTDLYNRGFGNGVFGVALKRNNTTEVFTSVTNESLMTINITHGGTVYHCILLGTTNNYSAYFAYYTQANVKFYVIIISYLTGSTIHFVPAVGGIYDNLYSAVRFNVNGWDFTCRIWATYFGMAAFPEINGWHAIYEGDITSNFNKNLKSRTPMSIDYVTSHVRISTVTSETATEYGMVPETGRYYDKPDNTEHWQPVRQDSWFGGISIWVGNLYVSYSDYNAYKGSANVDDFYLFTDAVRAVIKKIDPSIEFEENDSHFLFDNPNPLPSSAKPQGPLYISQKSNVLNLGYDYPAWQAPVKWSQIETFLKNALGCYWDLYEDSNGVTHLRIEHQFFYDNGGTYNPQGNQSATIDLLHNRFDVATRQPQAFHTNRWKWDVDGNGLYSSACRYEYGWMDTQSAIFDGDTVEVPEEYRLFTDDKTEERKVDWFSSDIDFLTAVQAECSSDGFVVVMESYTNPGWIVSGHENYSGQNYQLSFEYLQPLYLVYGIYAEKVQIGDGNTAYDTGSHARMRTSEVSFNLLEGEWAEPSDVLITEAGEGVIDTLTYDMSSEKWTATVRYNNE